MSEYTSSDLNKNRCVKGNPIICRTRLVCLVLLPVVVGVRAFKDVLSTFSTKNCVDFGRVINPLYARFVVHCTC